MEDGAMDRGVSRFDRWAGTYDWSFLQRRVFEPVHAALRRALEPLEGASILDVDTDLSARDLLEVCLGVERQMGRVRAERWGLPRLPWHQQVGKKQRPRTGSTADSSGWDGARSSGLADRRNVPRLPMASSTRVTRTPARARSPSAAMNWLEISPCLKM